jgi:hypothetical protein
MAPGGGFLAAVDAVLTNGVKAPEMAVGPAEHTEGVGNIADLDQSGVGLQRVKHNVRMGHDFAHRDHHRRFFPILHIFRAAVNGRLPAKSHLYTQV